MYWVLFFLSISIFLLSFYSFNFLRFRNRRHRKKSVAFFHPYTNDGGGGERVLWCSVKSIQEDYPELEIFIFTGDHDATPHSLSSRAINRFGVSLTSPPKVVHLDRRKWIDASSYPRFTMIGQSLGSVYLAWEALRKLTPTYFFDTSGYAFTYPLARLFGCKVVCYTHYPTISSDMISRVRSRNSMYNNNSSIAHSGWLSRCKLVYYLAFSWLYGLVGSCAHISMVNSSWTQMHIQNLWRKHSRVHLVYPPCNTRVLEALPLERSTETRAVISVAQFRPEKAHGLQLEAFYIALKRLGSEFPMLKLRFVGSCRNEEDEERLRKLRETAREMKVENHVEFHKNVTYSELVGLLGGAVAGIHSMVDEHFGISVVEYMAAGAIPIAHNSAGPKMDIVVEEEGEQTGFLAENADEYAEAIMRVVRMPDHLRIKMAAAARRRASSFSDQRFYHDFKLALAPLLSPPLL